jgi:hypothetical protein
MTSKEMWIPGFRKREVCLPLYHLYLRNPAVLQNSLDSRVLYDNMRSLVYPNNWAELRIWYKNPLDPYWLPVEGLAQCVAMAKFRPLRSTSPT